MTEAPPPAADERLPLLALAERWADYTKALAIYPEANRRVQETLSGVLEALGTALRSAPVDAPQEVALFFHTNALVLGEGQEKDLDEGTSLRWLHDRIHAAALAGVVFLPDADGASLTAFTRTLLRHWTAKPRDASFEDLWPETFPGLRLVERRFAGRFDKGGVEGGARTRSWREGGGSRIDTGREQGLVERLLAEDAVAIRIARLRARLGQMTRPGETLLQDDLLGRLVRLLPADARTDHESFVTLVAESLDRFEEDLTATSGEADQELRRLLFAAGQGLLAHHRGPDDRGAEGEPAPGPDPVAVEQAARTPDRPGSPATPPDPGGEDDQKSDERPRGHAGDDGIADDAALLLREWAGLPTLAPETVTEDTLVSPAEVIGAHLHVMLRVSKPEVIARAEAVIEAEVRADPYDGAEILRQYVRSQGHRADAPWDPALDRLVAFLRSIDQTRLLRQEGILDPEAVTAWFPRWFGAYLDGLCPEEPGDVEEASRTIAVIGPRTFREAEDALVTEEHLLEGGAAARWLAGEHAGFLPLARLLLARGDDSLRRDAARYLKRVLSGRREALGLMLFPNPLSLPASHLLALAEPDVDGQYPDRLRAETAMMVCRFVRATRGQKQLADRRAFALRQIAPFGSEDVERLAREILGDRRFVVVPCEPKVVRNAAEEILHPGVDRQEGTDV